MKGSWCQEQRRGYFVGYPSGVKGYRIWCPKNKKCIINRDVTFHETKFYKSLRSPEDQASGQKDLERFELEVEPKGDKETQPKTSQPVETEQIDDPGSQGQDQSELQDYNLTRDRVRRDIRAPKRYGYADMISYALQVAEDLNNDKPRSFVEAMKGQDS